jgi:hypothetical protein
MCRRQEQYYIVVAFSLLLYNHILIFEVCVLPNPQSKYLQNKYLARKSLRLETSYNIRHVPLCRCALPFNNWSHGSTSGLTVLVVTAWV